MRGGQANGTGVAMFMSAPLGGNYPDMFPRKAAPVQRAADQEKAFRPGGERLFFVAERFGSVRQRIRTHLDLEHPRALALAGFAVEGRAGAPGGPDAFAFPAGLRVVDAAIEAYLQAEQPYDCAGSAKAESLGIAVTEKITSDDPTALIGLPLITLVSLLQSVGCRLWDEAS